VEGAPDVPRKKARTETEVNGAASSSASCGDTLFFDEIEPEVLDNVIRFLSLLPNAVNWSKHVPISFIVGLFRVNGSLGTFLCNRFDTLRWR